MEVESAKHAPRGGARLLNEIDAGERDRDNLRKFARIGEAVSTDLWIAWMRQGDMRGLAPDGTRAKDMLPERDELMLPGNTRQENSVLIKELRLAEAEGHRLCGEVRKPRNERAMLQ